MPTTEMPVCVEEKETWGIEDEEEDTEVLVCRMEELMDVVTLLILVRHTDGNDMLQQLKEDIRKGRLQKELRLQRLFPGTEHPGRSDTKRRQNSDTQIIKNGGIGSSTPGTPQKGEYDQANKTVMSHE